MLLTPFYTYGVMVTLLPFALLGSGVWLLLRNVMTRPRRVKRAIIDLLLIIYCCILWIKPAWCDKTLWYCFMLYFVISGYQTLRPVWAKALERQSFWRHLGSLTVWGFALLMLLHPRSALSEALTLLGAFLISWGVFQLLLPSPKE